MKEFKKGDKVTIKDLDAVIKNDFGNPADSLDNRYQLGTYKSLVYLKNNYGVVGKRSIVSNRIGIKYTGYHWYITEDLVSLYNDISLPDELFKLE